MSDLNIFQAIGRLGKDPVIRSTQQGTKVASFSIATSEKWKDKAGEKKEKTEWHNCVAWDKLAEIIEKYLKKGGQCYISGPLQTRKWEKDGINHYSTEVVVKNLQLLGGKPGAGGGEGKTGFEKPAGSSGPAEDNDDLPF